MLTILEYKHIFLMSMQIIEAVGKIFDDLTEKESDRTRFHKTLTKLDSIMKFASQMGNITGGEQANSNCPEYKALTDETNIQHKVKVRKILTIGKPELIQQYDKPELIALSRLNYFGNMEIEVPQVLKIKIEEIPTFVLDETDNLYFFQSDFDEYTP